MLLKKYMLIIMTAALCLCAFGINASAEENDGIPETDAVIAEAPGEEPEILRVVSSDFVDGTLYINGPGVVRNSYGAYSNDCKKIVIGEDVTSIGAQAFGDFRNLTTVEIKGNISEIGDAAFYYCLQLTEINIPDSVTRIDDKAFGNCKQLTEINIPDSVTSIGEDAFMYCESLSSVKMGKNVETIKTHAFWGCSSLSSILIPAKSVGDAAFRDCSSLTSIYFTKNLSYISVSAFQNSKKISDVYYEGSDDEWVEINNHDIDKLDTARKSFGFDPYKVHSVSLNNADALLVKGDTETIMAGVFPNTADNQKIHWVSSDDSVVTVTENGEFSAVLTAVGKGKATVSVISDDGDFKETCDVSVVLARSITLDKEKLVLAKGEEEKLTPQVFPEDAAEDGLIWKSSNPKVATVEDGVVRGVSCGYLGEATITVTSADTNNSIALATCDVKVWEGYLILNAQNIVLTLDGDERSLSVNNLPEGFDDVTWRVSDNSIASIDSATGKIKGIKPGTTTATATAIVKGKTYEASCPVYVWKGSINLLEESVTLKKGEKVQLHTDLPDNIPGLQTEWNVKTLTGEEYSINGRRGIKAVAYVDHSTGVLSAAGIGTAEVILTYSYLYGDNHTDTCSVIVERNKYTGKGQTAIAGVKTDLSALLNPNGSFSGRLRYTSSNKMKAAVTKKGIMTPKSRGEVTISLEKKSGGWSTVSSCVIQIEKPKMKRRVVVTEEDVLNANDYLSDTEFSPTSWKSLKPAVATIDSDTGEITVLKKGSTRIIAEYGTGKNSSRKNIK